MKKAKIWFSHKLSNLCNLWSQWYQRFFLNGGSNKLFLFHLVRSFWSSLFLLKVEKATRNKKQGFLAKYVNTQILELNKAQFNGNQKWKYFNFLLISIFVTLTYDSQCHFIWLRLIYYPLIVITSNRSHLLKIIE